MAQKVIRVERKAPARTEKFVLDDGGLPDVSDSVNVS